MRACLTLYDPPLTHMSVTNECAILLSVAIRKRYIATLRTRTQYARAKFNALSMNFLHSSKMEWTQMLSVITAVHLQPDTVLHLVFLQMISRRN